MDERLPSIFTVFALQQARIINKLYPCYTNPPHISGPRRPDMQEQELKVMLHKAPSATS